MLQNGDVDLGGKHKDSLHTSHLGNAKLTVGKGAVQQTAAMRWGWISNG